MLNRVQVIGNLGADPEIRAAGGTNVANLNVAVTEKWKDKNSGEARERTEWVRCTLWGGLSDVIERLGVRKGDRVYVEGKMETRKWQDKEGNDRYTTEVVARGFDGKFVAMSNGGGSSQGSQESNQQGLDDSIPF